MNYQEALAYMSKAKNIDNGRPTGQRGTRMLYDTHHATKMPLVSLRYHNSILVQWTHDYTLFTNNGWNTLTTMNRIREHLRPLGYTLFSMGGIKYLHRFSDATNIPLNHSFCFTVNKYGAVSIKH